MAVCAVRGGMILYGTTSTVGCMSVGMVRTVHSLSTGFILLDSLLAADLVVDVNLFVSCFGRSCVACVSVGRQSYVLSQAETEICRFCSTTDSSLTLVRHFVLFFYSETSKVKLTQSSVREVNKLRFLR
jgi:hypothetical protein